jgi:hypothetical protein
MEVSSHIEGRIRIRDAGFRKEALLTRAREALLGLPGVSEVEANPRVGSLLVIYAAAVTAVQQLLRTLSELLGSGEEIAAEAEAAAASAKPTLVQRARLALPLVGKVRLALPSVLKKRVLNNIGMLVTLGISLGAAAFYLKKLHILAGLVFVGLFGIHLFERRKQVFA